MRHITSNKVQRKIDRFLGRKFEQYPDIDADGKTAGL